MLTPHDEKNTQINEFFRLSFYFCLVDGQPNDILSSSCLNANRNFYVYFDSPQIKLYGRFNSFYLDF